MTESLALAERLEALELWRHALVVQHDGVVKVLSFLRSQRLVGICALRLQYTAGAYIVACRYDMAAAGFVFPLFVPNPRVFIETEKFAAPPLWTGTEQLAANFCFPVDESLVHVGPAVFSGLGRVEKIGQQTHDLRPPMDS
jgi:hypothetical protein